MNFLFSTVGCNIAANSLVGVGNVVLFLGHESVNRRINVACYF